ncbi:MAG TPA: acyltransferase [Puia sp.]|nr:acyltransferase [Puia sp.]
MAFWKSYPPGTSGATPVMPEQRISGKTQKQFLNYIHYFRGIAILFVVGGHAYLTLNWNKGSFSQIFFDSLWQNGSVLFVFIAGFLFQHLSWKFEYKRYLKTKALNVLLPYLIISTPELIYRLYTNRFTDFSVSENPDIYSWTITHKLWYLLSHGAHLPQLWFVPMIIIFYLIAPLLIYMDRHPKLYYTLFISIAVSLLVERKPFSNIPKMFVHFFSVYQFGMFISHYREQFMTFAKKNWVLISILSIGAFIATLVFYTDYSYPLNYIHKMLFCVFFLYWSWRLDKYIPRFLGYLAEISFGIFFVHYYFNIIYYTLCLHFYPAAKRGTALTWLFCLIFVIIGSVALIEMIKKVFPNRHRNIVGC